MQGGFALGTVYPEADAEEDVTMFELAAVEHGAGGRRELLEAFGTGELPSLADDLAGLPVLHIAIDPIDDSAPTVGAIGLTVRLCPTQPDERIHRLLLGHASDALEIKRPSPCRGEKMLRLILRCSEFASDLMNKSESVK